MAFSDRYLRQDSAGPELLNCDWIWGTSRGLSLEKEWEQLMNKGVTNSKVLVLAYVSPMTSQWLYPVFTKLSCLFPSQELTARKSPRLGNQDLRVLYQHNPKVWLPEAIEQIFKHGGFEYQSFCCVSCWPGGCGMAILCLHTTCYTHLVVFHAHALTPKGRIGAYFVPL